MASSPEDGVHLTICSAGYGEVTSQYAFNLAGQVSTLRCPIRLDYEPGCYVHANRNNLLERALASKSTHMLFIDTDIAFPPDGAQQLLSRQKDIIGGAYNLKSPPTKNEAGKLTSRTTVKALPEMLNGRPHDRWVMDKSKPFECAAVPTGFMMIRLEALRRIRQPDFMGGRVDGADGPRLWFNFANEDGVFVGEDVYFCKYVRAQGLEVWCDPTIKLGHIGPAVY